MFTWICPKCGREVPPSYGECPDCAAKTAATGESVPEQAAPAAPPAPAAPRQPQPPARSRKRPAVVLPTWLLAILFAIAFLGVVGGAYWLVGYLRGPGRATPSATVENPAAKPGSRTNPFQRYIEVSGVRFTVDPKQKDRILVKFVLTNHSEANISGLSGNVTIWGRTQTSEEEAQGSFAFTTDMGGFQSKEMTASLDTKFKIYELPDWQNTTPDLQIIAPGGVYQDSPEPR